MSLSEDNKKRERELYEEYMSLQAHIQSLYFFELSRNEFFFGILIAVVGTIGVSYVVAWDLSVNVPVWWSWIIRILTSALAFYLVNNQYWKSIKPDLIRSAYARNMLAEQQAGILNELRKNPDIEERIQEMLKDLKEKYGEDILG